MNYTYNEYIKDKLISLYYKNEKIGLSLSNRDTLSFFNELILNINPYDYSLSLALVDIANKLDQDKRLTNLLGESFLSELDNLKDKQVLKAFQKQNIIIPPQITTEQKEKLVEKYTSIAKIYGLKEFYYSLNPLLKPEENFNQALNLLDKTKAELSKLQQVLDIKDSYKIGNGILSIQVNSQYQSIDNGEYNFLSNTIRLKDEKSTFPLIHEYIHFLDKTTASLLLTGKTTQQLYETQDEDKKNTNVTNIDQYSNEYVSHQKNKKYTKAELKELFDMSIFTQIDFRKDKFPWISKEQFFSAAFFHNEINQAKYIQKIFNYNSDEKNNIQHFSNIILNWIEEKNYTNKDYLESDIKNLFKDSKYKINHEKYSSEENEIIAKSKLFKESQLTDNYFMKCSKLFDKINSERESKGLTAFSNDIDLVNNLDTKYYQTQKEMLARTIEQILKNNNHEQLSDRLTTPKLADEEKKKFIEILKSWQNISFEILENQNKEEATNKIQQLLGKFRDIAIEGVQQKLSTKLKI